MPPSELKTRLAHLPVWRTVPPDRQVQVATGESERSCFQFREQLVAHQFLRTPLRCEAGHFVLPDGPGLGVEVDEAALRARTATPAMS